MAVDLTLAKQHLRVEHTSDDDVITQYLNAAIAWVENYTGKLLTRREVEQELDGFTSYLPLFYGPDPDAVTVDYTDADDAPQTIAEAIINRDKLYPASTWPSTADNTAITVTYTAGYTDTPADLDSAVLLLVGDLYKARETNERDGAIEMAVEALCRPYRTLRV